VLVRLARLAAKQQSAALLATAVDYVVMTACASGAGMNPALATACGALVGAVVGFTLGRHWVFRAANGDALAQAWRYLAVSLVSLLANAGGEALLVRTGLHYLAARPIISTTVGLGWNLPMQQLFVFRGPPRKKSEHPVAPCLFSD
jgi:putative flippase GtrA